MELTSSERSFMCDALSRLYLLPPTIFEEGDDLTKFEADLKDDSVVLAQLAVDQPVVPLTPLANPYAKDPNAEDPSAPGVQALLPKGDEKPQNPLAL